MALYRLDEQVVRQFPKDFMFGTATAAYQIEGAADEEGRGRSIWDVFSETPGKTHNGDHGKIAIDHYHRFQDDIQLMKELGIQNYRFSFSWPRLFPQGNEQRNPLGFAFYDRLIDELIKNDIKPMATLYHWDLPAVLQDDGGWENRETAYRFATYADAIYQHFGDRIEKWITHNEPWCVSVLGNLTGEHAPGYQSAKKALTVAHHVLLSHGLAVEKFRQGGYKGEIGITLNLSPFYAQNPGTLDDVAQRNSDVFTNRWFLDPIFKGEYPTELHQILGPVEAMIHEGDLDKMSLPIDFLGINYYMPAIVAFEEDGNPLKAKNVTPRDRLTSMGWPVSGEGLRDLLLMIKNEYGSIPLYITENGAAYDDVLEGDHVHDEERIHYLYDHLVEAAAAISQGVNLKGYFVWSFIDNFEWAYGYEKRFGIVYCDYATLRRIKKDSAFWYHDLIRLHQDLQY